MSILTPHTNRKRHFAMCFNTTPGDALPGENPAGSDPVGGAGSTPAGENPASSAPTGDTTLPKYSDDTPLGDILALYPDLKDSASLTKYKTMKDLLEGHKNLDSKMGSMIGLPKEDATDEEKALVLDKIYKKLGKPETADGYELPVEVPEGLTLNKELQDNFKKTAYELNLTADQARKLQEFHNNSLKDLLTVHSKNAEIQAETDLTTQIGNLKTAWGAEYKTRTQIAMNTARYLLSKDTLTYLDKSGLGNNANFIQDFYNISKKFTSDSSPVKPNSLSGDSELSQLEAESLAIRKDKNLSRDSTKQKRLRELSTRRAELVYEQNK